MKDGGAGSLSGGETLASPDDAGSLVPVVPAGGSPLVGAVNPAGPDGPVVAGGPLAHVRRRLQVSMGVWIL